MKTKKTVLTLILSAVLMLNSPNIIGGGIPVFDGANVSQNTITAFQEVASLLKQIQEYSTQLKQYQIQIKDNSTGVSGNFSEVQKVIANLKKANAELLEYKEVMKQMDGYLQDFQMVDYYKTTPCFSGGHCTTEQAAEYKKNAAAIQRLKVLSNEGLFKTVENQIESIDNDVKKLANMKSDIFSAKGQGEAIQVSNQFLEMQNAQMIQLRKLLTTQADIAAQEQRQNLAKQAELEAYYQRVKESYKPSSKGK